MANLSNFAWGGKKVGLSTKIRGLERHLFATFDPIVPTYVFELLERRCFFSSYNSIRFEYFSKFKTLVYLRVLDISDFVQPIIYS